MIMIMIRSKMITISTCTPAVAVVVDVLVCYVQQTRFDGAVFLFVFQPMIVCQRGPQGFAQFESWDRQAVVQSPTLRSIV
eukprot:m.170246 g.170246  ORF g.170246 m.170246 type:complete len:80 (-) comp31605_c3_seq2:782-1021(-)